jgi:hypothetical protein
MLGSVLVCAVAGAIAGSLLARRARSAKAALPLAAFLAAACALALGYAASNEAMRALEGTARDAGLRLESADGYASLHAAVLSNAFLFVFPVGLVAGQVAAWVAHRRAAKRLRG